MSTRVTTEVSIRGMLSMHAVHAVYTGLSGVDGILSAYVSLGRAVIVHDGRATHAELREAIDLAGCEVTAISDTRRLPVL